MPDFFTVFVTPNSITDKADEKTLVNQRVTFHFPCHPTRLGPLLEQAHDLIRRSDKLSGLCQPVALSGMRRLLRAMNSYYSNKIEGQHTLPLEIERALRDDYAQDADKARRQRLALAHMATEQQLEALWPQWDSARVWPPQANYEEQVVKQGVRREALRALLKRGLLESDTPYGKLRLGVPQHALRFYFPRLWPEAEGQQK